MASNIKATGIDYPTLISWSEEKRMRWLENLDHWVCDPLDLRYDLLDMLDDIADKHPENLVIKAIDYFANYLRDAGIDDETTRNEVNSLCILINDLKEHQE